MTTRLSHKYTQSTMYVQNCITTKNVHTHKLNIQKLCRVKSVILSNIILVFEYSYSVSYQKKVILLHQPCILEYLLKHPSRSFSRHLCFCFQNSKVLHSKAETSVHLELRSKLGSVPMLGRLNTHARAHTHVRACACTLRDRCTLNVTH